MDRMQRVGGLGQPAKDGNGRKHVQHDAQQVAPPDTGDQIAERGDGADARDEADRRLGDGSGDLQVPIEIPPDTRHDTCRALANGGREWPSSAEGLAGSLGLLLAQRCAQRRAIFDSTNELDEELMVACLL